MSALEARNVSCARGDVRLFRDVSFTVAAGEWVAVRGANGSGKTTLLRCIAGLTRPEAGEVVWDGKPARGAAGFRGAMLYAGHSLGIKDELSAEENLRDALALRGVAFESPALDDALASAGLARRRHLPAGRLSAGQRRRISMARLVLDPANLWILDEPLTALDAEGESMFTSLLERHLRRGGSALVATHHAIATPQAREVGLSQ
jgi:heme exporter protein A